MQIRRLFGSLALGVLIVFGCGDSGESDDGTGGGAGTGAAGAAGAGAGTGATGADGGAGLSGGGGTGATGTGGTGTGGTGTGGVGTGGTGTGGVGTGGAATGGTGGVILPDGGTCIPLTCQGKVYKCGNCLDDDGDGKADLADPDCLGPCHNAEDTFYGSIPGQNAAPCKQDCYFDQDTGSGNDDCYWSHECDPKSIGPDYPPEGLDKGGKPFCEYDPKAKTPGTTQTCAQLKAKQSTICSGYCGPLTPNGCDCFGCCEVGANIGTGKYVWLGSTDPKTGDGICELGKETDPTKCRPCTPVDACLNTCEKCELCLGKTTLPPECFPPPPDGGVGGSGGTGGAGTGGAGTGGAGTGGAGTGGTAGTGGSGGTGGICGGQICPAGAEKCGLSCQPPCPAGKFCLTGCCQPIPQ